MLDVYATTQGFRLPRYKATSTITAQFHIEICYAAARSASTVFNKTLVVKKRKWRADPTRVWGCDSRNRGIPARWRNFTSREIFAIFPRYFRAVVIKAQPNPRRGNHV